MHEVKEERNVLYTMKRIKDRCISHILRRSCVIKKQIVERKTESRIEVTGRQERSPKQLLDNIKKRRRYWKLKKERSTRSRSIQNSPEK